MSLWQFTKDDVVRGLRERGLPVDCLDDLTTEESEQVRKYTDLALGEAVKELLNMLAERIKRGE